MEEGYYEITTQDGVILPHLQKFIALRFAFEGQLDDPEQATSGLRGLEHWYQKTIQLREQSGETFSDFEKRMLKEWKRLIEVGRSTLSNAGRE